MADRWDVEKRSWVMGRIRGKDTRPERIVRGMLHGLDYRFTVNGRRNRALPGRPDIVLPKWGAVVFVHGCFWHAHEGCKDFRIPKTRSEWWRAKLEGNRERDARVQGELRELGWNVVVVWGCELGTVGKREELVRRLPFLVERRMFEYDLEDGVCQMGRVAEVEGWFEDEGGTEGD